MLEPDAEVTISVIELSSTDYSVLKVAVTLLEKTHFKVHFLEKGNTTGTLVLVDFDTPGGKDFYRQFNYARHRAMLLLSTETLNDHRNVVLKKPLRVQTLKDVLYDLYLDLNPQLKIGQASTPLEEVGINNLPANNPVNPQNNLFLVLFKALQEKSIIQVFCSPHSPLFVNTISGIIASSLSNETLHKIILSQSHAFKSTKLSSADFEILAKGQVIVPLNQVIWNAALYGSHGQLIAGHSSEVPIQLKAWPNLSRLDFEPNHMKLASIMAGKALTLKQIQLQTHLPWETIVGFYNAAYATNLIVINPANLPTTTSKSAPVKASLLAKIANRLKIAS
jgi:hypothetical protein